MASGAWMLLGGVMLVATACGEKASGPSKAPQDTAETGQKATATALKVTTGFYPTAWLTERIASATSGAVTVRDLCPPKEDPALWLPSVTELLAFQESDLVVLNGADFAQWPSKASLPMSKVVDSARAFKDELLTYTTTVTHSHGPGGAHTHEGIDGHTWVDPMTALLQGRAIHAALVKARPDLEGQLDTGLAALSADLKGLDASLLALSEKHPDLKLLSAHLAFGYLARRYGWGLEDLDLDPKQPLTAPQLARIEQTLEKHPAKVLLWESAPSEAIAEQLQKQFGIVSVVFSTVEHAPTQGDYRSAMAQNIKALAAGLDTAATQQPIKDPAPSPPPTAPDSP
ncbi:MAG: metal ABC transporter solute-binding protein, Zn/Mn family [Bradymonadia bacterium]